MSTQENQVCPKLLFARPLDDQERATLEQIMAGDNETLKQRSLIVLLSSEERYRVPEIAPMVGLHVDKVRKWVIRFNKHGLKGLQPPRRKPGPRGKFDQNMRTHILEVAEHTSSPAGPITHLVDAQLPPATTLSRAARSTISVGRACGRSCCKAR